jgi:hypothetical protein
MVNIPLAQGKPGYCFRNTRYVMRNPLILSRFAELLRHLRQRD